MHECDGGFQSQSKPKRADEDELDRRAARKHCVSEQPQDKQHGKDGNTPQIRGSGGCEQRAADADV